MSSPALRAIINLDLPGATISRHLYGHFAEHLGRCIYGGFWVGPDSNLPNHNGIRLDVVNALRKLKIPNLRWPGGCFADEYHWRDGIGPREQRPRMINSHWGDVVEDNSFGTHEFMELCELLGADPYISGNVGSGTVQEMSDWVEYVTRDDDSPMATLRRQNGRDAAWKVPFWGIGNEPWGCGGTMTAHSFTELARQYSTYTRNHGGNQLYRIAAGASDGDFVWTKTLMEALSHIGNEQVPRDLFQAVSFHAYTLTGPWEDKGDALEFTTDEHYLSLAIVRRIESFLEGHSAMMDVYDPGKKVGLVLDEWGTWWNPTPGTNPGFLEQQNALRDALVASYHFDAFHRHAGRLVMANIAQTVNVLQAMLFADAETGSLVLTPTYHVFEMNTGHHDARTLSVHVLDETPREQTARGPVDVLSTSASTKDGSALISLTNGHATEELALSIDLRGAVVTGATGRVLTAPTLGAHNTPTNPAAVAPRALDKVRIVDGVLEITLPPASYTTVSLALGAGVR
ncbi:alpha-N-arabinofuranosidase [Agromyces albus]|uniref:non-reducing end alpha-L-arabinofuranosidase n=1 Tax=Agromyces albus TaxID=205332 RepID=A0A4Q2L2J7_9MICO|nr:alpha-L-arabinofuranosidase C-terminal domain-containing protein [Agromyces albus]RXZ70271.1 alpha-N-arabinofuranosidase [Agromyces albus]